MKKMRTIIVGGGACGASCAARLRRQDENAEIIILEATEEISIANCGLPYYCSDVINDRERMIVAQPSVFSDLLNVDVRFNSKVTKIDSEAKTVKINNDYEIGYDNLVLALGASPIKPPIEGINNDKIFSVRTLNDADRIKAHIAKNDVKNAVVIGGGFIGAEMAENFIEMGLNTTLVELSSQILAPVDSEIAAFAQNEMRANGCKLVLNDGVKSFGENEIELNSGERLPYDIAILAIGVKPETQIAKEAGLELGMGGAIKVNEFMQTSVPSVWAGGDSVEILDFVAQLPTLIPLAGPANRQGRIIADNICGKQQTYKASQGTAVVKIFNKTVASVGKNEKQLKSAGVDYLKNIIQGGSHAGYYPDSTPLFIKLLFSDDGKILGAQAVGNYESNGGVEKRIDVIATVMRLGGSVQDLIDTELCYAPPYSSAKDPVNILGMSSKNILDGLYKPAYYDDLKESILVDVRPKIAFDARTIDGAISIPATELRTRHNEIPRDKKVVLFCQKGYNSYTAARILEQQGFENVSALCGGKNLYDEIVNDKMGFFVTQNLKQVPQKSSMLKTIENHNLTKIDCSGMQCPGPIMKLAETVKQAPEGQIIEVTTTDSGFGADIEGWCATTKNTLLKVENTGTGVVATIAKGQPSGKMGIASQNLQANGQTIVVFSNDLDKALAAMIIANGAKASGKDVTLFFTFWGLNILRKPESESKSKSGKKSLIDKMFGLMMPEGAEKLVLSKMNMGGLGTMMMKWVMKKKNVLSLNELLEQAKASGVKIIACTMAMDIMGINEDELIDGIEFGGVAKYISESNNANSNLFI